MRKRQVFTNSVSGAVLFGVNLVIAFALSPVVVRELGDRGYGVWEIFLSVFGYLSILELGVGPAFIRFVARAAAQDDRETMNRVVSSALAVLAGAGLFGFLAANVLLLSPHRLLNIDPAAVPEVRLLALLLSANFFVQLSGTAFTAYLMGMQRHYVMNGARVFLAVVQAAVTYVALTRWSGSGLVWLSAILLGANILQFGFFAVWSLARKPAPSIRLAHVNRDMIRELYAFGMKSMVMMVSGRVAAGSVPIIMGWILGAGQIVFYAIPNRLALYAAGLGAALGFPLMPYFSALDGKGDRAATLEAWFNATRALQFVMVGMAVGMLGLGGPFIARWIGPAYAEQGAWVIRCLGAALLVEAVSPNSSRLLMSMNRHGWPAVLTLSIAVLGVPLTILLAKVAGVTGVGLSVLLIRGFTEIAWLFLSLRVLGLGAWEHLRRTVLTFAPAALLFAAVLFGLRRLHEAVDYPRLVVYALTGGVAYALGVWFFALRGGERGAVLAFLGGLRRRTAAAAS